MPPKKRGRPKGSKNKCSDVDFHQTVKLPESVSPFEQHIGKIVGYYLDGERAGYLLSCTETTAKIKPMAAYKGVSPHTVSVPVRHITIL